MISRELKTVILRERGSMYLLLDWRKQAWYCTFLESGQVLSIIPAVEGCVTTIQAVVFLSSCGEGVGEREVNTTPTDVLTISPAPPPDQVLETKQNKYVLSHSSTKVSHFGLMIPSHNTRKLRSSDRLAGRQTDSAYLPALLQCSSEHRNLEYKHTHVASMLHQFFLLSWRPQSERKFRKPERANQASSFFLFFPLIVMRDFGHSSSEEECQQSTDCREVMIELCKTNKR
jgi:hypothetical protein